MRVREDRKGRIQMFKDVRDYNHGKDMQLGMDKTDPKSRKASEYFHQKPYYQREKKTHILQSLL